MKNLNFLRNLFGPLVDLQSNVVRVTSGGASDEHPMSTRSASDGDRWKSVGNVQAFWKYAAMLVMLFTIGSGNAWGETITLNVTSLGLGGSYTDASTDVSNVTFEWTQICKQTDIQFKKSSVGAIWNSSLVPGKINSVQVTFTTAKQTYLYWGTSAQPTTNQNSFSSSTTKNSPTGCFGYVHLVNSSSNASKMSSIVITYTPATITLSKSSITGLDYSLGSGPSASQTFTVSGSNIPANLTVTAPTNFEVSLNGSSWASSQTISVTTSGSSGGTLSSTTVYVRLASGKSAGNYSGNVSIAMVGCNTISGINPKTVAVSGTVSAAATPTVTVSPASVTFAANTLSGGEASGSSTIDFSVTNGSQSSGQYLCAWPESDDANCEFTINNGAYSYCSGSATSVDDLSIEYYAIAAGTFTGRIYVNGYKANGDPVEETIELSVTISGPVCDKSVTINKGTSTNCSFTLSKSGAQASCSGVSTTVTVSPSTGYGNPSVTQSGASAAPTISGSSNTWTVAYGANTTGTSTINVSCSANNYTITLNTDLTPTSAGTTSITATYNANTNLTSAITKPTKTGWTFGGYFTAKNGGGTQIIDASGNVIASVSGYTDASRNWKYAGNITLYAKWTCTVTWSVNGLTNVYPTQTVTYNSSGSKVASVPTPDPASYCGDIFAGWSQKNAGSESKTTSYYDDLFKTVGDSPDIKSIGNITFYAVFADEN